MITRVAHHLLSGSCVVTRDDRRMGYCRSLILVVILCLIQMRSGPSIVHSAEPPSYKLLRYEERYMYLRDPDQRTDLFDPIKYIPLSVDGEVDLSFGGQLRLRHSYTHNPTWGDDPQINTGQFLQRYVVHGDAHLGQDVRVFVQLLSALEDSSGEPSPVDEDRLALLQAFIDLRLRLSADATLTLRPGRQVWRFGSQRLIGVREGPNVRRRFDAIRLTLNLPGWELNGLVGQPAQNTPGIFDDDTNDTQTIWGLYTVWRPAAASVGAIDLYYLGFRQKRAGFDQGTGTETRHTVGVRVSGSRAGWDYNWEGMVQWGTFGEGDIQAWTLATVTGYTWDMLVI